MRRDRKDFESLLRENGISVTPQRLAVLAVLSERGDSHLTAEEIYALAKRVRPGIGLATVYRTIQVLLELKIINRICLDDGSVRYELGRAYGERDGQHHHLVCVKCGRVVSFDGKLPEDFLRQAGRQTGFQLFDYDVKLYGYCPECKMNLSVKKKKQEEIF